MGLQREWKDESTSSAQNSAGHMQHGQKCKLLLALILDQLRKWFTSQNFNLNTQYSYEDIWSRLRKFSWAKKLALACLREAGKGKAQEQGLGFQSWLSPPPSSVTLACSVLLCRKDLHLRTLWSPCRPLMGHNSSNSHRFALSAEEYYWYKSDQEQVSVK